MTRTDRLTTCLPSKNLVERYQERDPLDTRISNFSRFRILDVGIETRAHPGRL